MIDSPDRITTARVEAGTSDDLDSVMEVMEAAFGSRFGEAWTRSQCAGILPMAGVSLMLIRDGESGAPLFAPGTAAGIHVAVDSGFEEDPADADIIDQIKELIETRVRPAVAQDGGDIAYHGYKDGRLYLTMHGACSGCPSSTVTLKRGIESLIRHYVPEVESVEAV